MFLEPESRGVSTGHFVDSLNGNGLCCRVGQTFQLDTIGVSRASFEALIDVYSVIREHVFLSFLSYARWPYRSTKRSNEVAETVVLEHDSSSGHGTWNKNYCQQFSAFWPGMFTRFQNPIDPNIWPLLEDPKWCSLFVKGRNEVQIGLNELTDDVEWINQQGDDYICQRQIEHEDVAASP